MGCVLWADAANAGPALSGLVVFTADRALPDFGVRLDPLTASLTLTRAAAVAGHRQAPACGGKWQAGARWAAAVLGLAGRRATGPGGYGREDTVRGSRQETAGGCGARRPTARAGETVEARRFGEGKLHPPLLQADKQPGTHVTSLCALLEFFSTDICLLQLLRVYHLSYYGIVQLAI